MGDVGDTFNAAKSSSQRKRQKNRESSPKILELNGIEFESKNAGAHLIVEHAGIIADFWPGTGKFTVRAGKTGRGVFNLVKLLKQAESEKL